MLNNSVCDGLKLTAVVRDEIAGLQAGINIGYRISRRNQDLRSGIPLTLTRKTAKFYLGFFMHLEADGSGDFMTVKQSMTMLALDPDLSKELLHYDYERDKHLQEKGYPEAHVQVCASSTGWGIAGQRKGHDDLPLARMHLPVGPIGGRRFRPTLEDVIEFMVVEGLVDSRPGWRDALDKTRRPYQELQLKAAVRRNQQLAIEALKLEGWSVQRSD